MLLDNKLLVLLLLLSFLLLRIFANEDLCRLIEFDVPENVLPFHFHDLQDKLFYKTDFICQNKPIYRSLKYASLYQFQSPNNRWWSLYDTRNSSEQLGQREWCDGWNAKPLLAMPLGMFQHPLSSKSRRTQRWQRVIINEKNNSYTYKSISNVRLKCYYPPSTLPCQTEKLTFLFDLTETSHNEEIMQMKLLAKTLIWLLYNQTRIALSSYRDTFRLISSFDNQTSSKSLEHLFDSIDTINENLPNSKRFTVRWSDVLHQIVTRIYKRRLLLPVPSISNATEYLHVSTNDSIDDEIYTEPYPLIYSDEHAIKTILNITTYPQREKRAIQTRYDPSNHVLLILTARSKYLYDYQSQDRRLAQFISSVPLRIVVLDFHPQSNRQTAEHVHSAFIQNAKYALASLPVPYNYIERYRIAGDTVHGEQLFDHRQRLCFPPSKDNFTTVIIETKFSSGCSLLTLFDQQLDRNATLKDRFDYTFYQTFDQCSIAPVYRSLADRNLYVQRTDNGRWLIVRVDPLLPSTMILQKRLALTSTSTLSPEFFYATDYANGPLIDDFNSNNNNNNNNNTAMVDLPISVPHCSNNPGIEIVWESDGSSVSNDYYLSTPRRWISNSNQTDLITPTCNKYKISCRTYKYDILFLLDSQLEYSTLIQTFFRVFLSLIDPSNHRLSLMALTSTTIDPFQYHLPWTTIDNINEQILNNFFAYTDDQNTSAVQLNRHFERISDYLIANQQLSSDVPSKQVIFTVSSRLNFDSVEMKYLIQRYPSIRYLALDPSLRTDDDNDNQSERERLLRSLVSSPWYTNLFWSYAANRDLTFNTVFRVLESLCGSLR